ncbi:MAG TPA: PKD domain-containing protein, partial [Flavobacterium sp.]
MKKLLLLLSVFFCLSLSAQNYNISNTSVSTCSGNFYDSGGAGGNYGNGQSFTMTFCPSTPGSAIKLNFSAFNLHSTDIMYIFDGNDIGDPQFGTFTGTETPGIVQATGSNTTGCITIRFVSDGSNVSTGWAAAVSCITPCQVINAQFVGSTPPPESDGIIKICQGESVTFNGSATFSNSGAGATYEWNFDNGTTGTGQTATTTFPNAGVYRVNLRVTDPANCVNNNMINQIVQVSTTPVLTTNASLDEICLGQSATITGTATPTPWNYQCTPPVSGTTFLPDGSGVSYTTSIVVDCFESGQLLTNANQLQSICLNMEHSYTGDLQIAITSPTGQTIILKYYNGSPGGGGGGLHLGYPFDPGGTAADVAAGPGQGFDYCFSMTGTTYLVNGTTTPTIPPYATGTTINAGTYLPSQSFAGLVGSLLNGTWTIQVTDNLASDNGYIFSWGLTFDPALIPGDLSFTPTIEATGWNPDPTITNTSGNTITVSPSASGNYCYTYWATDNFGCTYQTQRCITVLEAPNFAQANDLFSCSTFDLNENIPVILNGLDPAYYPIMFHHSQDDAENVFDEITNPGNYPGVDGEIIYYSIQDQLTTAGCIYTGQFQLHVTEPAAATQPPTLTVCDDPSNDAVATFDFTPQTAIVLGTNDPAEYAVSYHVSQADADTGLNDIDPIDSFENTANCQTIYVRMEPVATPECFDTTTFEVCVIAVPDAPTPADVTACEEYELPVLPPGQTYHENTASGTVIPATTVITTTQTITIVAESGTTPNCTSEGTFIVTIVTPPATPVVSDVSACDTYTLPALPAGQSYHSASGGNSPLSSNVITTTQDIFVVAESGTTPNCTSEASFTVTINDTPPAPAVSDVTACNSYTLPTLPVGQSYHSASGGSSPITNTTITTTQVVYVVAETGTTPNCTSESSFTVTINTAPPTPVVSDVTVCDTYTLPALPAGQTYHSATGGASPITNTTLTATQDVYVFAQNAVTPDCNSEASFTVTINYTPATPTVTDITVCDSYMLPTLPAGQTYHQGTASGAVISAGTIITTTQTIIVVDGTGTTPNCTSEASFTVTINDTPPTPVVADVTACDSYTLPALPAGQSYHNAPGGSSPITNTTLTVTQDVYVFTESGTIPNCTSEASFTVTINYTPATPVVSDVTACDSYTLPALPAGQTYHTASGGTSPVPSTTITATQDIFVFAATGTTPNCTSESSFTVTINDTPATPVVEDVIACDSYTLPVLPAGQSYHSAPGGSSPISNTTITVTQDVYIFAQSGTTPNCTSESSFTVTINNTPATPVVSNVTACDSYILPALPAGQTYHTASGGSSPVPSTTITATQDIFVFAETGTTPNCTSEASFTVTINYTPPTPVVEDVTACDSYTLPALPSGQSYHNAPGGSSPISNTTITVTQDVYIFAQSGTTPNCTSESSFTVTIHNTPATPVVSDVTACDSYTLPELP